jgi:hypothetical protein
VNNFCNYGLYLSEELGKFEKAEEMYRSAVSVVSLCVTVSDVCWVLLVCCYIMYIVLYVCCGAGCCRVYVSSE